MSGAYLAAVEMLFRDSSHFIGVLDTNGRVRYANPFACKFVGCQSEAVIGQQIEDAPWWRHSARERERLRVAMDTARHGHVARFQTTHVAATELLHAIDCELRPLYDQDEMPQGILLEATDIGPLLQAEGTVETTKRLLDVVIDVTPIALVIASSAANQVEYLNRAAEDLLGTSLSAQGSGGRPVDVIRDQDWTELYADGSPIPIEERPLVRALRGEATGPLECRLKRKDGAVRWVLVSGTTISDERRGVIVGVVSFWDVTEQKEASERYERSERMLAAIFRATPEMLVVSRVENGCFLHVNDAFTNRTGFERDEIIGRTSLDIGLWPSLELRQSTLQRINASGEIRSQEAQLCHKSGHLIDVLMSGAIFVVDGEHLIVWVISDIGEYKRAQEAILRTEERFQRLVENSNDVIVVTDESGKVLSAVGPLTTLIGYSVEELVPGRFAQLLHPEDLETTRQAVREILEFSGGSRRVEVRLQRPSGEYIALEAVGRNLLDDPNIHGVVWNIREITERKQAEAERARLHEQLQHAMKMEAVGRLAGGVAHDFNNLLTVISGNLELAKEGIDPLSPLGQTLREVTRAADSAANLTRQLLAFSRRQVLEPKNVDLRDLVENLRKMLSRLVGEDVILEVEHQAAFGTVKIDPSQFEQVLVNLVVNARDAMPGGGRLSIGTHNVVLDATDCRKHDGLQPGAYVLLSVRDTGVGMDADVKLRLFEPFFTTKARGRGTGLGLAMIFGAVKQARGAIEVESELGRGTTVKIYLPRVDEPAISPSLRSSPLAVAMGPATILLVEDEAAVREVAETMLLRLGYRVLVASGGAEALRLAKQHEERIDILMTDIVMPEMNGRELAETLCALHTETRVLYTSGYTEDVILLHGVERETGFFLGKPYTLQILSKKLRQVLDSPWDAPIGD
jgi:PAS domain S-box-containing protein